MYITSFLLSIPLLTSATGAPTASSLIVVVTVMMCVPRL